MANDRDTQITGLPLQVKEFVETREGKTFLRQQAKRALLVSLPMYVFLCETIISVVINSNVNYLNPKRGFVFICFVAGILLAQVSADALYHQIILFQLYRRIKVPKGMQKGLPFQNPKVQIATGLSILLIITGIISCLIP